MYENSILEIYLKLGVLLLDAIILYLLEICLKATWGKNSNLEDIHWTEYVFNLGNQ